MFWRAEFATCHTSSTMVKQVLLILIFMPLLSLLKAERNVFLPDKIAHKFLARTKRANSMFEELKKGNIERECKEEMCSKEEAREAFEDAEKTEEFWNVYVDGDQCVPDPCQYGGTCKDGIKKYTCTCLDGYHGDNCELVIQKTCKLDNGDCAHFCKHVNKSVECSCAEGYILADDGESCVATVQYPCGQVQKRKKTKREASSFGQLFNPSDDYDVIADDMYLDEPQNSTNLSIQPPSENKTQPNSEDNDNPDVRIVGGQDCELGECPWQALLVKEEGDGFCGGTILNKWYVLTAAHCISEGTVFQVLVGEVNLTTETRPRTLYTVERIYRHQKFQATTYDFDIALIKLKDPIRFSENVIPACLPTADFANQVLMRQQTGRVSGFGRTHEKGRTSSTLKVVDLPYVDRHTCKLSSTVAITENMFCAGYSTITQDACQGDSGGPHVTEYKGTYFVTGVISWGEGCARDEKYGIYTKVSKFLMWLKRIMRQNTP
uniref:coagulation factor Xa n=1 Tax=Salvator merianae TaxID=96440 RepID=A0A8D0B6I4_SALMN